MSYESKFIIPSLMLLFNSIVDSHDCNIDTKLRSIPRVRNPSHRICNKEKEDDVFAQNAPK